MKLNLGPINRVDLQALQRLASDLERAFEPFPQLESLHRSYEATLNFSAPGAVPGITSQTVSIEGARVGDIVVVGAPVAAPAGFLPPVGEVTADDTVKVHWLQFSGAAADPDGGGGTYNIDLYRR
jgi:hypothetical protein